MADVPDWLAAGLEADERPTKKDRKDGWSLLQLTGEKPAPHPDDPKPWED